MAGRGREAHLIVGVVRLEVFLPENHSLKGKRGVLRTIKARVQNKFNVSIAECADQDLWQKAVLGIAQVGSEQSHVDAALSQVVAFIERMQIAELGIQDVEFLHY